MRARVVQMIEDAERQEQEQGLPPSSGVDKRREGRGKENGSRRVLGKGVDYDLISKRLVAEALGKRRREDEWEDDGEGMMVRKKQRAEEDEKEKKRVDVRIPVKAVEAGARVVKEALSGVVVVEEEQG